MSDGEIHAGTTVLKSATANFVANDTGKSIYIEGAGAGGTQLSTLIGVFINPMQVTLNTPASTSVSSANVS